MGQKSVPHFTRDATGLIRNFSWWDGFGLGIGSISPATGMPFLYATLISTLPGANIFASALIILVVVVCLQQLVYAMMGTMLPRSGFDYVANSRMLSPAIGFAFGWIIVIAWLLLGASYADLTGTVFLQPLLASLGQTALANSLSVPAIRIGLDTAFVILGTVVTLLSIRTFAKIQTICVVGGFIAMALMFTLFGSLAAQGFAKVFDSVAGSGAYQGIIAKSQSAGSTPSMYNFSVQQTLLGAPILLYYTQGLGPTAVFGEFRTVSKTMIFTMFIAPLVAWILLTGMAALYYPALGVDFAHAISYLSVANPSASPFGSSPFLNSILTFLYPGSPAVLIIDLGIWLSGFLLIPQSMLFCSRYIFAWSFDRIIPEKFSTISRFRTPWVTALTVTVLTELILLFYVFTGVIGALLNSALLFTPIAIGVGLSSALIPYRKKSQAWFENAPSFAKAKIGPIPFVVIGGLASAVGFIILTGAVVAFPQIGYPVSALNVEFQVTMFILAIVVYYLVRAYRSRKEGFDIGLNFSEIPPE